MASVYEIHYNKQAISIVLWVASVGIVEKYCF